MVRITKVYTKKGDQGMTSLAANLRLAKTSKRIIAIGEIDEFNAFLGWTLAAFPQAQQFSILQTKLLRIQNELFNLGAQLSVLPQKRRANTPIIQLEDITRLENELDEMNDTLPTLQSFILPGGGEIATRLHIARTVCRRAERALVALNEIEKLDGVEIPYLNRLSDWLFVTARFISTKLNYKEILWESKKTN